MKINDAYLMKRTQINLVITEESYITGFLYVLCYLFRELKLQMEAEGRFFGRVISYMNNIEQVYKNILPKISNNDEVIYQKILYLHKPVILNEYRRLCKKRVTKADSLISIIKRILDVLQTFESHQYHSEIQSLNKVITRLYDNIRNNNKTYKMSFLVFTMLKYIDIGQVGNQATTKFSISDEEEKFEKKELSNPGIRLEGTCDVIGTDII